MPPRREVKVLLHALTRTGTHALSSRLIDFLSSRALLPSTPVRTAQRQGGGQQPPPVSVRWREWRGRGREGGDEMRGPVGDNSHAQKTREASRTSSLPLTHASIPYPSPPLTRAPSPPHPCRCWACANPFCGVCRAALRGKGASAKHFGPSGCKQHTFG